MTLFPYVYTGAQAFSTSEKIKMLGWHESTETSKHCYTVEH